MIRPEDFQILIEYDTHGTLVVVNHPISGIERNARPSTSESVGQIKNRLLDEIERELYNPADLQFEHGHSRRDGKVIGYIRVTHLPTGINAGREMGATIKPSQAQFDALGEVVAAVWRHKSAR